MKKCLRLRFFKKQHGKKLQKQKEREAKLADLLKEEPVRDGTRRFMEKLAITPFIQMGKNKYFDEQAETLKDYLKKLKECRK